MSPRSGLNIQTSLQHFHPTTTPKKCCKMWKNCCCCLPERFIVCGKQRRCLIFEQRFSSQRATMWE